MIPWDNAIALAGSLFCSFLCLDAIRRPRRQLWLVMLEAGLAGISLAMGLAQ